MFINEEYSYILFILIKVIMHWLFMSSVTVVTFLMKDLEKSAVIIIFFYNEINDQ